VLTSGDSQTEGASLPPIRKRLNPPHRTWWKRPVFGIGLPLAVGLVHVALVAPHYFVGSFDDDASYILTARALVAGQGLAGHVASGAVVSGSYAPGYSALMAPLVWIWPHSFLPLRLLSVVFFGLTFVLTWIYLGRRGIGEGPRVAALGLLALGPPLATYGSMVMAETPFLATLLVLLILVDKWDRESRVWTRTGVGVIAAAGALIWLKEAGVGVVAGLLLWLLLRPQGGRRLARPFAVGLGVVALLLPVVAARLVAGVPVTGSRYSSELGAFYQGNLVDRVVHVIPHSTWHLLATAIPATLVPYLSPIPFKGHWARLWEVVSWQVTLFILLGAVVWFRKHRDAALTVVAVYLLETVFWPEVNERRAILVVPVLAAWYVLGVVTAWKPVRSWSANRGQLMPARMVAAALAVAVVVGPLVPQMPRDYLFKLGQNSSHFEGSRYASLLSHLGTPSDIVETDYLSSTALFTGHRTAWTAFNGAVTACYLPALEGQLAADKAAFLLLGNVNKPGVLDSPCLFSYASSSPGAVRLLHTSRDNATVFELIGPGTGNPTLTDLTSAVGPVASSAGRSTILEWNWGRPEAVDQVTVGEAAFTRGETASVSVELRRPDGVWSVADSASSPLGDERGAAPYLLATFPAGEPATAMRVVMSGPGSGGPFTIEDVHALGPDS
jgi:hypothetical protein